MLDKYGSVLWTALALFAVYAIRTLQRWRYMRLEQFSDFPQVGKPSLIWGHLAVLAALFKKGDPRRHIDEILLEVSRENGNPELILMDLRPVQYPVVVVASCEVAEQITRPSPRWSSSTPKSPTLGQIWDLTGKTSLVFVEGDDWKAQRKRLNPGFAPQHLLTTLPLILEKTMFFINRLEKHVSTGSELLLDKPLAALTFDIIGAVVLGQDLKAQIDGQESEIFKHYMGISALYSGSDVSSVVGFKLFVARRRAKLAAKLEARMMDIVRREHARVTAAGPAAKTGRSVLSLSLQGGEELTPQLLQQTSDNLRAFLFAGHDTTSILMQWALYELSRSPKQRAALFAELDALFGPDSDPQAVSAALLGANGPELVNSMIYTMAVIKETLRLHPPAASVRMTPPGTNFQLNLPGGKTVCPDGCVLYINPYLIQRDAKVWGETVDDFVPERWLGDTSWMTPGSWRPFERGPRMCIGLELANIEAKVILALVARRYDFVKVGLGELDLDGEGQPMLDEKGYYKTKSTMFNTIQVTAKPVDGMPMKISLNKRATNKG